LDQNEFIALDFLPMKPGLLFEKESYRITGACFEVYREKGCGFLEPVYQECMEIELRLEGIPYLAQKSLPLEYKSVPLRTVYEPDFICFDKIILELKAVTALADDIVLRSKIISRRPVCSWVCW
jgi:GxxExxY protein